MMQQAMTPETPAAMQNNGFPKLPVNTDILSFSCENMRLPAIDTANTGS